MNLFALSMAPLPIEFFDIQTYFGMLTERLCVKGIKSDKIHKSVFFQTKIKKVDEIVKSWPVLSRIQPGGSFCNLY